MADSKKLRVEFFIVGLSDQPFEKEVSSVEEAKIVMDSIADFVNYAVEKDIMPDHCNCMDFQEYDEEMKEWCTWYDENGYDIEEHFDMLEEQEEVGRD